MWRHGNVCVSGMWPVTRTHHIMQRWEICETLTSPGSWHGCSVCVCVCVWNVLLQHIRNLCVAAQLVASEENAHTVKKYVPLNSKELPVTCTRVLKKKTISAPADQINLQDRLFTVYQCGVAIQTETFGVCLLPFNLKCPCCSLECLVFSSRLCLLWAVTWYLCDVCIRMKLTPTQSIVQSSNSESDCWILKLSTASSVCSTMYQKPLASRHECDLIWAE